MRSSSDIEIVPIAIPIQGRTRIDAILSILGSLVTQAGRFRSASISRSQSEA